MKRDDLVWSDRKRNWLGLPWTFTVYGLTEDRLFIKTGVLNIHEDEVRLYRILDLSLRKTLWQRIMGLGTIHVDSSDKTIRGYHPGSSSEDTGTMRTMGLMRRTVLIRM